MSCHELDSLLLPFLDDELEADARAEIEAHLTECAACAGRLHAEAGFQQGLKAKIQEALAEQAAPEALRLRIRGGLRQVQRRDDVVRWATGSAAAAALVVVVAGSIYYVRRAQLDRLAETAAKGHARTLPLDVQDPRLASSYLAEQLERGVPLPHFPNAVVRGARFSNGVDKPAGYVVYDVPSRNGDLRRMGLYVFDDSQREVPVDPFPTVRLASRGGYNVAQWREEDIVYELVSDLDESDIKALLDAKSAAPAAHAELIPPPPPAVPLSSEPLASEPSAFVPASFAASVTPMRPPHPVMTPVYPAASGGFQQANFQR